MESIQRSHRFRRELTKQPQIISMSVNTQSRNDTWEAVLRGEMLCCGRKYEVECWVDWLTRANIRKDSMTLCILLWLNHSFSVNFGALKYLGFFFSENRDATTTSYEQD